MTIIQQPDSLSFSLNLKPIKINTAVDVAFILTQDGKTVLSETLSPDASDMVEVSLRDIIHGRLSTVVPPTSEPFEQPGSASDFTVAIGSESFSFRVIRGGVDRPSDVPSAFARANFLTWQPTLKRVTYSSPEYLSYYAVDNGCAVKVRAFFTDGETVSSQEKELCTLSRGVVTTFSVQYAVISGLFSSRLPAYYDVWVANGSTSLTYTQRYVADIAGSLDEDWFIFENSLGGIDSFRAYGPLDLAYRHEHNLAEMDDTVLEYRVDTERLMTKSTGRLSRGEAAWMADFFPSVGKYICLGGSVRRISVTDSSVSGKVRTEPVSFSFTFRIADALPLLNLPRHDLPIEMLGLTVPDVGSFTLPPRLLEFPRQPLSEGVLFPVQEPYSEEWAVTTLGGIAEYVKGKIDIPSPGLDRADLFGILGGKPRAGERINPEFIDLSGYLTPDILGHYATFADLVRSVNNKLDTQFFASVFTVYDEDGNPIVPNTYEQVAENLQVMVGAWTERYLSALGKNPDEEEGGGGVSGIDPVEMWKLLGGAYQTNEVIGVSHIPGLPADKITSGIFSIDRIPNIPLAKIPDLQQTLQQLRSDVNAKLDTRFFASVFTVYDEDGNPIVPNTYEQAAENLQVMVGAWTERYLSALGKNDDESGGGGMSPEELWTELGSSPWTDRQISADHLTDALAGYVKKISFGSKDYAAVSGTVTIPVISNNPTLAFGAAAEILKLGDTSVKVTMPAANITEGTITIGSNSIKPLTGITSKHVTDALGYTPADVNELLKYYTKTEVNAFTWWGQKLNDSGVVSGDMTMNNGDAIIWKSPSGNAVATQSVLTLNSSNNVHLGSTDKASTHNTYINGVNIYLRTAATGTARGNRVTISSSGAVTIAKTLAVTGATTLTGLLTANGGITIPSGKTLQIGGATLSWDSTNNMLKVDTGFYSEKSVSALGANDDSGSGGGELDEGKMWGYLGGSMDNKVISLSHIPELETLTFSYGSVASASGSITYNGHTAKTVVIPNTLDHIADGTTRKLPVIAYKDKKFTLNNSDLVSAATIVSDGGGIKTIKINGTAQAVTNNAVNLPAYPTLKGLMGSTPIGAAKTPIYWDGSGFKAGTQIKDLAYKDSLAFSEITDKPTTLSGYGITDAYTESEIDTKVTAINESIGNKADKTINISAGNGLQGGGDLTEDRTLSIKLQSNSGLTVASAGLKLDIINNLTTANAYKAISATQAKKIWDLLNQMFTLENTGTSSAPVYRIKANYGLYSEQYISALGANGDSGSGVVDRAQVFGYLSDNGTEQIGKTHLTSALAGYLDGVTVSTVDGATVVTDVKQNGTKVVVTKSKVAFSDYAKKDDLDNYFALYGGTNLTPTSTTTVNLDTIKAAGSYYCALNANAKNVDGRPATGHNVAFRLWVVATTGTSTNYVRQIFSEFSTNKVYERYIYQSSGTWSDWELTGDELSAYIRGIANTANANTLTITKGDGTTSTLTVGYATKAAQDGNGNNIVETYATKTSLEGATKDITTLKDYFTNGVANSAVKLNTGTTTYSAWGQTYWQNGVPNTISGDMSSVGTITFIEAASGGQLSISKSGLVNFNAASSGGWAWGLVSHPNDSSDIIGMMGFYGVGDAVNYAFVGGTYNSPHLVVMGNKDSGKEGYVGIGTKSPTKTLHVDGTFGVTGATELSSTLAVTGATTLTGLLTANGGITIPANKTLKIGTITLTDDNGLLKIDKGVYSLGTVSALGANTDTSGGGTGFDESDMWEWLGGSMTNKKIDNSHLNFTIGDYLKKSITNDTQTAAANQEVVVGIEYNGSTGGLTVKKSAVTLSNYLPLSAGSGNALTGNLCFGNNLGIFMKNSAGANCQVFVLNSSSNSLHLGGSANVAGFNTYVSGKNVYLRYVKTNGTFGTGLSIDQSGLVTVAKDLTVSGTTTLTGAVTASSSVTASSFIKSGGTSSQFLKADGSVDSNTYATTSSLGSYLPLSGGTLTGSLAISSTINSGGGVVKRFLFLRNEQEDDDSTYYGCDNRIYSRQPKGTGTDYSDLLLIRLYSRKNKTTDVITDNMYLNGSRCVISASAVAADTQGWCTFYLGTSTKITAANSCAGRLLMYAPQPAGATAVYYNTLVNTQLTANRIHTLPNITGTFIMDAGAQTITGVKTFSNGLTAAAVNAGFIEMKPTGRTGDGGYIDFHYNNSDADFTSRIIEDSSSHLHIYADSGVYISGYVTSANEVTANSDERMKNIAGDIRLSVKDIASAPSVYFYWKDGRDKKKHIGSIAQYWGKVLPESVSYDGQGYMSLNYQSAALAAAIAIARAVSEHESRLTKLERENKALKKRITKLETELERRA